MKPIRASAVIKTDHGLLLGGDSYKDWHREEVLQKLEAKRQNYLRQNERSKADRFLMAKKLVEEQGRLSLIGGTIDPIDYVEAGQEAPLNVEGPNFLAELEQIMRVVRITIAREIDEELALSVDPDSIQFIKRIIGQNRNHIICTVYAEGRVKINRAEILGLGLMTDKLPAIPQNHYFTQKHVELFRSSYLANPTEHAQIRAMRTSKINVSKDLVQDLFKHQCQGYEYARGNSRFKDRQEPYMLKSTPNFLIY